MDAQGSDEVRKTVVLPVDLDQWIAEQAKEQERSWAAQLRKIVKDAKAQTEACVPHERA